MTMSRGSIQTTQGVEVQVTPTYLPGESNARAGRFVFGYQIRITNKGDRTVQLLHRNWLIVDGDGDRREVRGSGVVGRQPILKPLESFAYSSGCPLGTPWGTMEGTYTFREVETDAVDVASGTLEVDEGMQEELAQHGKRRRGTFEVAVARFYLVAAADGASV